MYLQIESKEVNLHASNSRPILLGVLSEHSVASNVSVQLHVGHVELLLILYAVPNDHSHMSEGLIYFATLFEDELTVRRRPWAQ